MSHVSTVLLASLLILTACAEDQGNTSFIRVVNGGVHYPPEPELVITPEGKLVPKR